MATISKRICDICGSENPKYKDIHVPVLVFADGNQREHIAFQKGDYCETCYKKLKSLLPLCYKDDQYESTKFYWRGEQK